MSPWRAWPPKRHLQRGGTGAVNSGRATRAAGRCGGEPGRGEMDAESSAAGLVIDAADLHASSESSEATTAKKAAAAAEPTFDALTATQMKARRTRRPPARGAPPQRLRLSVCVCRRHPTIFCARACSRAGVLAGVRACGASKPRVRSLYDLDTGPFPAESGAKTRTWPRCTGQEGVAQSQRAKPPIFAFEGACPLHISAAAERMCRCAPPSGSASGTAVFLVLRMAARRQLRLATCPVW